MNDSETSKGVPDTDEDSPKDSDLQTGELMCWKDPTKVCRCDAPRRGVYCGRFPLPTD